MPRGVALFALGIRASKAAAIASSTVFLTLYLAFTGLIVTGPGAGDALLYVQPLTRDPLYINTAYAVIITVPGVVSLITTLTPLATALLAMNTVLVGLNVGGLVRLLKTPGCCSLRRLSKHSGLAALAALGSSVGLVFCCGGGIVTAGIIAALAALGMSPAAIFSAFNYYIAPTILAASALGLLANFLYMYKRLWRPLPPAGGDSTRLMRLGRP